MTDAREPPSADMTNLRPATDEELAFTLSFALRFRGRKPIHDAGETMGQIVAERLIAHLRASGYVVMKKPPLQAHGSPALTPAGR